ncbi:MAG: hypothetical protein AB8B86_11635 [Pseudomonadales bacterium]
MNLSLSTAAYHESAHAVVGIQFGGRITKVSSLAVLKKEFCIEFKDDYGSELDRKTLLSRAITFYAGYEADKLAGFVGNYREAGAADDYEKANALLMKCCENKNQFDLLQAKVLQSTRTIVSKNWPKISRLAKLLQKSGELPGYKVISLIEADKQALDPVMS